MILTTRDTCKTWTFIADLKRRLLMLNPQCWPFETYWDEILNISSRDNITKEEIRKITAAFGLHDNLHSIVKKEKWCDMYMWQDHPAWHKPSCNALCREEDDEADRRRGGNWPAYLLSSQGIVHNQDKWGVMVRELSVVKPHHLCLWDWWWWWWSIYPVLCVWQYRLFEKKKNQVILKPKDLKLKSFCYKKMLVVIKSIKIYFRFTFLTVYLSIYLSIYLFFPQSY